MKCHQQVAALFGAILLTLPNDAIAASDRVAAETFLTYCMTPEMTHAQRVELSSDLGFRPLPYDVLAQFSPTNGSVGLQGWLAADVVDATVKLFLVSWVSVEDPDVEGCMVYFDDVDVEGVTATFTSMTGGQLVHEGDEGGWHEMVFTFENYPGLATLRFSTGLSRGGMALVSLTGGKVAGYKF